jgi:NADH dehydrogenase
MRMPESRRRRLLVREAAALLHYLLRRPARPAEVRTLARQWSRDRDAAPLLLPRVVLGHPRLLGALVPAARRGDPSAQLLHRRLMTACCVAEASAGGFARFCLAAPASRSRAVLGIAAALGEEAMLRLCAPLLRQPTRPTLPGDRSDGA